MTNAHAHHIYVFNDGFEEYEMFTKYKVKIDKDGKGIYDVNVCIETSQTAVVCRSVFPYLLSF